MAKMKKIALSILFDWIGETLEAFVVRRAANLCWHETSVSSYVRLKLA